MGTGRIGRDYREPRPGDRRARRGRAQVRCGGCGPKAPALADVAVIRQWAGMYDISPDHQPLVGPNRQLDGWWQANGWSGRGMLLGRYLAELLAERFVTGVAPDRLAMFDPDRFAPDETPEHAAGDY